MSRKLPALGISSCLLGMNVRYDGANKQHTFISTALSRHFDLFPVCPEVAIGMGVPRAPIQLRMLDGELRAVGADEHTPDVTMALRTYGQEQATQARAFCGYIFKNKSPSCGISDTRIFSAHGISAGPGLYAREIFQALPYLPIIDETRLDSAAEKDNFLERVFALVRWHQLVTSPLTVDQLIDFHTSHQLMLAAHNGKANAALSETISVLRDPLSYEAVDNYLAQFHNCLKKPLMPKDHIRLLKRLQQDLAPVINRSEKERLDTTITNYRENQGTLVMPLKNIKQLAESYNIDDLARGSYINPTPTEVALRYSKQ